MKDSKSWIEIVLMPLAIVIAGLLGTYFITQQQIESAHISNKADRQIKIIEIFAEGMLSEDPQKRIAAIGMVEVLEPELSIELVRVVITENEKEKPAVKQAAEKAIFRAKNPRIHIHIQAEEDRARVRAVGEQLKSKNYVIADPIRLTATGPNQTQLRYFRKTEKKVAEQIVADLKKIEVKNVELNYIKGYEHSDTIQPQHYELWIPPLPLLEGLKDNGTSE